MNKLFISPTYNSPEMSFAVNDNLFRISGISRPEDARKVFYPVLEWLKEFADNISNESLNSYSKDNPLRFQVDLSYFNSSSAKFLYDIICELNHICTAGIPLAIEWYYESEDTDMLEAGQDMASLAEIEFTYISKAE